MTNPNIIKVKIIKASPGNWYEACIGEVVEVYESDGLFFLMDEFDPCEIGTGRCIAKDHCVVVSKPYVAPALPHIGEREGKVPSVSNDEILHMHLRGASLPSDIRFAVLSAMNEFAGRSVIEWQKGEEEDEAENKICDAQPMQDSRRHIPAEALEKIEKCAECRNDEIRPHFYKAMCFGYLLAIGKLSSYHWTALDPQQGPQATEIPAPAGIGMDMAKGPDKTTYVKYEKDEVTEITKEEYEALQSSEPLPVQQGEVPEDVMDWIHERIDMGERENDAFQSSTPFWIKDTAIALYHRDQEQIKALELERDQYKQWWERSKKNNGILIDRLLRRQSALEDIIKSSQRIKDNPNCAFILKLAEAGIKD